MRPLLQKRGESGDLKEKSTAGYYHLESLTPETQAQPLLLRGPARAIEEAQLCLWVPGRALVLQMPRPGSSHSEISSVLVPPQSLLRFPKTMGRTWEGTLSSGCKPSHPHPPTQSALNIRTGALSPGAERGTEILHQV